MSIKITVFICFLVFSFTVQIIYENPCMKFSHLTRLHAFRVCQETVSHAAIYVSHYKFQNVDTCLISVSHMRERNFADFRGYCKLPSPSKKK